MEKYTELIEDYLLGNLSPEDKADFEKELLQNPELQKEFEAQEALMEGVRRLGIKGEIVKTIRSIKAIRYASWTAIIIAFIGIAGFLVYQYQSNEKAPHIPAPEMSESSLPVMEFLIQPDQEAILETPGGMMIGIEAGSFDVDGPVQLKVEEALTPMAILKAGLSTTSDGELLETGGMFSIHAFSEGREIEWKKDLQVFVPAKEISADMMLFDGEVREDGSINWVNPKPIEKDLITVDITTLDFYPERYIPTLKSMGEAYNNKVYTDSLYYSFSGYMPYPIQEEIDPKNGSGIMRVEPMSGQANNYYFKTVQATQDTVVSAPAAESPAGLYYELDPSRIKAIWNSTFNGTLLATPEFEERLRFIHSTCNPNYLENYLKHLDWPMWKIDSLCMMQSYGAEKSQFEAFYKRKDGGVKLNPGIAAKLQERYGAKQKAWKTSQEKVWKDNRNTLDSLAEVARLKNETFNQKDAERYIQTLTDEICRNYKDAVKQLGGVGYCNEPLPEGYSFTIATPGWKNLDQYVIASTVNRENMEYIDPESGKKATLTYTPVEIKIENESEFDRVLVYMLPDSLSSFQRIFKEGDVWKEKLNSNLNYQLVAIGYKGEAFYSANLSSLTPGQINIHLEEGDEAALQKILDSRPLSHAKEMKQEMEFQRFFNQERIRIDKVKEQELWREMIAASIFNCYASQPVGSSHHGDDLLGNL